MLLHIHRSTTPTSFVNIISSPTRKSTFLKKRLVKRKDFPLILMYLYSWLDDDGWGIWGNVFPFWRKTFVFPQLFKDLSSEGWLMNAMHFFSQRFLDNISPGISLSNLYSWINQGTIFNCCFSDSTIINSTIIHTKGKQSF